MNLPSQILDILFMQISHISFCLCYVDYTFAHLFMFVPDAPGVQDKTAVMNLQSQILDTLRKYSINRYPNEPRRYGKMLLRLPALRSVSAVAADRFLSMSLDGSIKMNALVLEMMS